MTAEHGRDRGRPIYIHELDDWPDFRWSHEAIVQPLTRASHAQEAVVGNSSALGATAAHEATVRNLTDSALASSRIEGEYPDPNAVAASIRRRITAASPRVNQSRRGDPGIAVVTADTATNHGEPLTAERLHRWHRQLFPGPNPVSFAAGQWRDDRLGPMRVVSGGPIGRTPVVHFEAPVADRVDDEMERFLEWFNRPEPEPDLRKPAIAHLWFVTIHPYDDGNGRIARAITDLALARCDGTEDRLYSMSGEILRQRQRYYRALQVTQSGSMDITSWMIWFLDCLTSAMNQGQRAAGAARSRVKLHAFAKDNDLNQRQVKFLSRLIDGWQGNVTAARYGRLTRCSQQTALSDIIELVELGILIRNEPSGGSASYRVQTLPLC